MAEWIKRSDQGLIPASSNYFISSLEVVEGNPDMMSSVMQLISCKKLSIGKHSVSAMQGAKNVVINIIYSDMDKTLTYGKI